MGLITKNKLIEIKNIDHEIFYFSEFSEYFFFIIFTEDGELRRVLQSLACGKARVLSKNPKVKIAQRS